MIPRQHLLELFRYGLVSAVAFAVDAGLLALLNFRYGVHYLVAATISFIVGGAVAYLLSIRFVFSHRRVESQAIEGPAFVALGLAGLAVNLLVMRLLVGQMGSPLLLAKLGAACGTFGVNYLLRKFLLFSPSRASAAPQERA
jgi:putative flippase GtrA